MWLEEYVKGQSLPVPEEGYALWLHALSGLLCGSCVMRNEADAAHVPRGAVD